MTDIRRLTQSELDVLARLGVTETDLTGHTMTERTDHAAEAARVLQLPTSMEDATEANALAYAQVHATLALVEQQRIANLIALARTGRATPHPLFTDEPDPWDFDERGTLRPEIAAALGTEGVQA